MRRSGLVIAAMAALCIMLAACGSTPAVAPEPSSSPQASLEPSIAPTTPVAEPTQTSSEAAEATEPPIDSVPIPSNAYARVVTDDLRVRSKPGVGDGSKKLEPLLQKGHVLVVLDGPVQASGYDWYEVYPIQELNGEVVYPFGWVAAGKAGEPWIEAGGYRCPPLPTDFWGAQLDNEDGRQFYGFVCWAGQEFTIRARLASSEIHCGTEPGWGVDPAWFDSCGRPDNYLMSVEGHKGVHIPVVWHPDVDLSIAPDPDTPPKELPLVDVTGMFDHPSAAICENRQNYPEAEPIEPDPDLTRYWCRSTFVVTAMHEVED
jgi:hypothetical protein